MQLQAMTRHPRNPLFATLAVTATLLLCALVPKALRDATMLLQYNSAQLEGGTIVMSGARRMSTMDNVSMDNVYIIESGECPAGETIPARECRAEADIHQIGYDDFKQIYTSIARRPAGCFLDGRTLFGNHQTAPSVSPCSSGFPCICKGKMRKALRQHDGKECEAAKQLTEAECRSAAHILQDVSFNEVKPAKNFSNLDWPRGCFLFDDKIWYNTNPLARGKCNYKGAVSCLCFETSTPLAAPPAVPTIQGAYAEECRTCTPQGVVAEGECTNYARSLHLPFRRQRPITSLVYPKGCVLVKKTLWYNKADSKATCDQKDTKCICGGGKEAYSKASGTCRVEDRLPHCDCKRMAHALGMVISSTETMTDPDYPAGCFLIGRKLWYNWKTSSAASCEAGRPCICARPR